MFISIILHAQYIEGAFPWHLTSKLLDLNHAILFELRWCWNELSNCGCVLVVENKTKRIF